MFDISRSTLQAHSVDMRQFIDCRESVLSGGRRLIDVYNSSGLTFTLLPDRGLDIWTAQYRGMPLTWISAGSPHRPDHGSPWLRQFNGGLLTTCGLQHSGPPEVDDETGEERDVHGHYTRLPADVLRRRGRWDGETYVMELEGRVAQSRLFGEQLVLERTYRITLGEPALEIVDVITNLSDVPAPFMLLYHINLGYPLVRDGSWFDVAAAETMPRDEAARAGVDAWQAYSGARAEYAEQVFYHRVLTDGGRAGAMLSNGDVGLLLTWATDRAPYLSQWKNVRKGMYVSGIEPGNCVPEGRNAARDGGRLVSLAPGEAHRFVNRLDVLDGVERIGEGEQMLKSLRSEGRPVEGFNWSPSTT